MHAHNKNQRSLGSVIVDEGRKKINAALSEQVNDCVDHETGLEHSARKANHFGENHVTFINCSLSTRCLALCNGDWVQVYGQRQPQDFCKLKRQYLLQQA